VLAKGRRKSRGCAFDTPGIRRPGSFQRSTRRPAPRRWRSPEADSQAHDRDLKRAHCRKNPTSAVPKQFFNWGRADRRRGSRHKVMIAMKAATVRTVTTSRWKPFSRSAVSASIRHSDGTAITPATSDRRTSEGAPDDEAHGKNSKNKNAKSENRIAQSWRPKPRFASWRMFPGRRGAAAFVFATRPLLHHHPINAAPPPHAHRGRRGRKRVPEKF
jgi:hypothetical protein